MGEAPSDETLSAFGDWGFIGAGALGASLARALALRGAQISAVAARQSERAECLAASLLNCRYEASAAEVVRTCAVIVLAVPDDALPALDTALPWAGGQLVIHLSGARGLDALPHAQTAGARTAAIHPLMIFPHPEPTGEAALARFAGCSWAVEASDALAQAAAQSIIAALGGRVIPLRASDRVPYHLAAVLSSNYVVTLLGAAIGIWQDLGLDSGLAREALLPLLRATVERLGGQGPAAALAGPVARGDTGTVAAHLAWLRARGDAPAAFDPADLLAAYIALAKLTVPLAVGRGSLPPEAAERLLDLLGGVSDPAPERP